MEDALLIAAAIVFVLGLIVPSVWLILLACVLFVLWGLS